MLNYSSHSIDDEEPLFLLGKVYKALPSYATEQQRSRREAAIEHDFYSRLWMTYRRKFPRIGESKATSDAGWGCMLRTAQMMLAQAFLLHYLGRDWRIPENAAKLPTVYAQIVRWFLDHPTPKCPYSIHNLLEPAKVYNKPVGEWYGPGAVCYMLKQSHDVHPLDSPRLLVAQGGLLCLDAVYAECARHNTEESAAALTPATRGSAVVEASDNGSDGGGGDDDRAPVQAICPIVIVLPVRLGAEKINAEYFDSLKACMEFPQSLGIMGGRVRSSLYFVGYQGSKLLYLDPHTIQTALDLNTSMCDLPETYHCSRIRSTSFEDLDPSLALAFYCKNTEDFFDFWGRAQGLAVHFEHPAFSVSETTPDYAYECEYGGAANASAVLDSWAVDDDDNNDDDDDDDDRNNDNDNENGNGNDNDNDEDDEDDEDDGNKDSGNNHDVRGGDDCSGSIGRNDDRVRHRGDGSLGTDDDFVLL